MLNPWPWLHEFILDMWLGTPDREIVRLRGSNAEIPNAIPLSKAALCSACECVVDSMSRCLVCQSDALIAITRVIPRHQDSIKLVCREA